MDEFSKFSEICMVKKSITDANQCGICDKAKQSPIDQGECASKIKIPSRYVVYYLQGLAGKNPLERTKPCQR